LLVTGLRSARKRLKKKLENVKYRYYVGLSQSLVDADTEKKRGRSKKTITR